MTHLDDMIAALDLEVTANRKSGGGFRLQLRDGEMVREADGKWLYRFALMEDAELRDDTLLIAGVNGEEIRGAVVSLRDGLLVIGLEQDLGPAIRECTITTDDSFLIATLKKRLEEVDNDASYFNKIVADRAIGHAPILVGQSEPHRDVESDGKLNLEQMDALRTALGSDASFIWGPPGTGKTITLARIVEAHYREGRSVLLVSNTNIAVDTALEQVAERLKNEDGFEQGHIVRLGPVVKDELRNRFGDYVIADQIVERLNPELAAEKKRLTAELEPLLTEERELQARLRSGPAPRPARQDTESRLAALASQIDPLRQRLARINIELAKLEVEILDNCRVLATTAYRAYLGNDAPRTFDVVVIDEASMLMSPLTYFAAGLASESVVVAGDFRQLAPIVKADGKLADTWLKGDVFSVAGIPKALEKQGQLTLFDEPNDRLLHLKQLVEQYRMQESICALVNTRFYDGVLKTVRDAKAVRKAEVRDSGFPLEKSPLLYLDTSEFGPWVAYAANSRSRYNVLHALLVQNIVLQMHEAGYLQRPCRCHFPLCGSIPSH